MNTVFNPVAEMSAWLAHPTEFGEQPECAEVAISFDMQWPGERHIEAVHLVRYRMRDGYTGIGVTGPVTWSFIGDVPFDDIDLDLLLLFYIGWFIIFSFSQKPDYQPPPDLSPDSDVIAQLTSEGLSELTVREKFRMDGSDFYELQGSYFDDPVRIISINGEPTVLEPGAVPDSLPALYWLLGLQYVENLDKETDERAPFHPSHD